MLPNHVPNEVLFNRQEAAQYLGVSPSTLSSWASSGKFKLSYFRIGKAVRYRKRDLDAFIDSAKVD